MVIWKGDIFTADFGRFGNDKCIGYLPSKNDDEFVFPLADGTSKLSGRDHEFRVPTLRWEQPVRSEDLSGEIHGESGESQPAEPTDDAEARGDFWSIQGDFIHRHHTEPLLQLYVPKEETFPSPLKYIDVTRSTRTDLDVMEEKKIDDYWNVHSSKHLSDSWRGFTKFTLLKEKPPKGYMWSWERLTQIRTTTRPDYVWPEVWTKTGKAAQNREKQEWAKEKPKFDNVRKLRGIYFIDPDDKEYSFVFQKKNERRKTEKTCGSSHALQARDKQHSSIVKENVEQKNGHEKEFKIMYGCMVESREAAVDKEWKKLETIPA